MGFSLTSTHIILFIAAVSVAGVVSGVFVSIITDVTSSFSERGERLIGEINTDFKIINDPENIPQEGGYYIFYLKNIGEGKLVTDNETFQIFVDGEILSKLNYYLSPRYIYPSEVAEIRIHNSSISFGTHQMKVVGPYAVADTFQFTIG
jgi:flagellar protein FlaG